MPGSCCDDASDRAQFWTHLSDLAQRHELVIDRPKGSAHPRFAHVIYPLDYGYLEGTTAADGDGIDVWRGSLSEPRFDALICTIDTDQRDAEIKLLLGCTPEEKLAALEFLNQGSMRAILVDR